MCVLVFVFSLMNIFGSGRDTPVGVDVVVLVILWMSPFYEEFLGSYFVSLVKMGLTIGAVGWDLQLSLSCDLI